MPIRLDMVHDMMVSTYRWLLGLSLGAIVALILAGTVAFHSRTAMHTKSLLSFFRAMPILALMPFFATYVGMNEMSKILLIAWATAFPVFFNILNTLTKASPDIERRFLAARLRTSQRVFRYHFPRLLSGLLSGVETSIGIAWLTVVAAEMISTSDKGAFRGGLGFAVRSAIEDRSDFGEGVTYLLLFGVLGIGSTIAWQHCKRLIVRTLGYSVEYFL